MGTNWFFVCEALECFLDVSIDGDIDPAVMFFVVPYEIETTVLFSFPVFCDFVVFLECSDKVLCCGVVGILDSKVIDCETE